MALDLLTPIVLFHCYVQAGAKKVLITAPAKGSDIPTYVIGVNADQYKHSDNIISNASCTTNCLAPFVKVRCARFGTPDAYSNTPSAHMQQGGCCLEGGLG